MAEITWKMDASDIYDDADDSVAAAAVAEADSQFWHGVVCDQCQSGEPAGYLCVTCLRCVCFSCTARHSCISATTVTDASVAHVLQVGPRAAQGALGESDTTLVNSILAEPVSARCHIFLNNVDHGEGSVQDIPAEHAYHIQRNGRELVAKYFVPVLDTLPPAPNTNGRDLMLATWLWDVLLNSYAADTGGSLLPNSFQPVLGAGIMYMRNAKSFASSGGGAAQIDVKVGNLLAWEYLQRPAANMQPLEEVLQAAVVQFEQVTMAVSNANREADPFRTREHPWGPSTEQFRSSVLLPLLAAIGTRMHTEKGLVHGENLLCRDVVGSLRSGDWATGPAYIVANLEGGRLNTPIEQSGFFRWLKKSQLLTTTAIAYIESILASARIVPPQLTAELTALTKQIASLQQELERLKTSTPPTRGLGQSVSESKRGTPEWSREQVVAIQELQTRIRDQEDIRAEKYRDVLTIRSSHQPASQMTAAEATVYVDRLWEIILPVVTTGGGQPPTTLAANNIFASYILALESLAKDVNQIRSPSRPPLSLFEILKKPYTIDIVAYSLIRLEILYAEAVARRPTVSRDIGEIYDCVTLAVDSMRVIREMSAVDLKVREFLVKVVSLEFQNHISTVYSADKASVKKFTARISASEAGEPETAKTGLFSSLFG